MIIYNRNSHLDKLLEHYGLSSSNDPYARKKREAYNVKIVTSLDDLKNATTRTSATWLSRIHKNSHEKTGGVLAV